MDLAKAHYERVLKKEGVALTGVQLLQEAKAKRWEGVTPEKIYNYLRQEAPGSPGKWGRSDAPTRRASVFPAKPGMYFIDYGEFHKSWAGSNNGATGFLVAVEQFTNRTYVLPTRGKDTAQWLNSIAKFVELTRQVCLLYSDRDSVAQSPKFRRQIQEKYNVAWRFLKKGHKAFTAERMIGLVKEALSKSLESRSDASKRWVDLVDPFVRRYNTQLVPGTGYKRQSVSRENWDSFMRQLTGVENYDAAFNSFAAGPFANEKWNRAFFKFSLGDRVRVSRSANWKESRGGGGEGGAFFKATVRGSFGDRLYTVSSRQLRRAEGLATESKKTKINYVPVYRLEEMGPHGCLFYESELQRAAAPSNPTR